MPPPSPADLFDPDVYGLRAFARNLAASDHGLELPTHSHRMGQLIVTLRGGVTCRAEGGLWMAPIGSGVWIPSGVAHSNRVTPNGAICLFFVAASVQGLPDRCCSLPLSAMVIETIRHLAASAPPGHGDDRRSRRIVQVVIDELRRAEPSAIHLPISGDPTLGFIAETLMRTPEDRATVSTWASRVAMSERALARLVVRETAMSFGRWRQQLHIVTALQKLSEGASVQTVSLDLGYSSASAFIAMFRMAMGASPVRYMRQVEARTP